MEQKRMVVEMMNRQDIKNEVIDYIRNSGESVKDYDVDAIVDILVDYQYNNNTGDDRMDSLMVDMFEDAVFNGRIA